MTMTLRSAALAMAGALFTFLAGCGSPDKPADATGNPSAKDSLEDLSRLLAERKAANKRVPNRPADLGFDAEATNPAATAALARGEITYVWGTTISGGPAVVAYEKAAATSGGFVLLQDGTVKEMTAAEFAAAPKAKK